MVGAYVLQAQGMATMQRVSQSMSSGEPPIKPVVDGFFLVISGAFLLTPGVVTDAIGLYAAGAANASCHRALGVWANREER